MPSREFGSKVDLNSESVADRVAESLIDVKTNVDAWGKSSTTPTENRLLQNAYDSDSFQNGNTVPGNSLHSEAFDAMKNFAAIDVDNNGYITDQEITDALLIGRISAEDRKGVRLIESCSADIATLSEDEWGFENDGLTMLDLGKAEELALGSIYAEKNFYEIDTDSSGTLSRTELTEQLVRDPDSALAISNLLSHYARIAQPFYGFGGEEISMDELKPSRTFNHYALTIPAYDSGVKVTNIPSDFARYAYESFHDIDTSGGDLITPDEAREYADTTLLPGDWGKTLLAFGPALSELSDDEEDCDDSGVSRADLRAYERQSLLANLLVFCEKSGVSVFDLKAIENALQSNSLEAFDRASLRYARDNFEELATLHDGKSVVGLYEILSRTNEEVVREIDAYIMQLHKDRGW